MSSKYTNISNVLLDKIRKQFPEIELDSDVKLIRVAIGRCYDCYKWRSNDNTSTLVSNYTMKDCLEQEIVAYQLGWNTNSPFSWVIIPKIHFDNDIDYEIYYE